MLLLKHIVLLIAWIILNDRVDLICSINALLEVYLSVHFSLFMTFLEHAVQELLIALIFSIKEGRSSALTPAESMLIAALAEQLEWNLYRWKVVGDPPTIIGLRMNVVRDSLLLRSTRVFCYKINWNLKAHTF